VFEWFEQSRQLNLYSMLEFLLPTNLRKWLRLRPPVLRTRVGSLALSSPRQHHGTVPPAPQQQPPTMPAARYLQVLQLQRPRDEALESNLAVPPPTTGPRLSSSVDQTAGNTTGGGRPPGLASANVCHPAAQHWRGYLRCCTLPFLGCFPH